MDTDPRSGKPGKKIIIFDNACPMCTAIGGAVRESSRGGAFDIRGIGDGSLPGGLERTAVEKEIHVLDADGKVYKGSEAVLKIVEEYPGLRFLGRVGDLPVIKQLLALGYKFVAANRYFIFGPRNRIFYLKLTLAAAFLAGFLLSVKLWVDTRFYPLTPVLKLFPAIPFPADYAYFFLLLAALVAIILLPRPRWAIAVFAVLLAVLGFLDQSRWQPWAYQYLFMLMGLGLFSWRPDDARGERNALNVCRIVVAGTYIWSGIQKVNFSFITGVFPWLLGPLYKLFPPLVLLGLVAPFVELGIGIGLVTKKYRTIAVATAVLMHLSILAAIGPFGLNWNSVIWPWQIAMMLFVILLFYRTEFTTSSLFSGENFLFSKIVLILFFVMPALNFFGLWDSYLSAALYSGNVSQGVIYMDSSVKAALPPAVAQYARETSSTQSVLNVSDWSLGEMNAPAYPATRIYKSVARYICNYARYPSDVQLVIQEKPTFLNEGDIENSYDCPNLF